MPLVRGGFNQQGSDREWDREVMYAHPESMKIFNNNSHAAHNPQFVSPISMNRGVIYEEQMYPLHLSRGYFSSI